MKRIERTLRQGCCPKLSHRTYRFLCEDTRTSSISRFCRCRTMQINGDDSGLRCKPDTANQVRFSSYSPVGYSLEPLRCTGAYSLLSINFGSLGAMNRRCRKRLIDRMHCGGIEGHSYGLEQNSNYAREGATASQSLAVMSSLKIRAEDVSDLLSRLELFADSRCEARVMGFRIPTVRCLQLPGSSFATKRVCGNYSACSSTLGLFAPESSHP